MIRHYYQLLGVDESVSDAELKKAYRKKARQLHPDHNPAPDAQLRFIELSEAYQYIVKYRESPIEVVSYEERIREQAREKARRYAEMRYQKFVRETKEMENASIHDIFFGRWITALLGIFALFFFADSILPTIRRTEKLIEYRKFCSDNLHCDGVARSRSFRFSTDANFSALWHNQPIVFEATPFRKQIKRYYLIDYPSNVFRPLNQLSDYFFFPGMLLVCCLLALFYPFRKFSFKLYTKTIMLFCAFVYGMLILFFSYG